MESQEKAKKLTDEANDTTKKRIQILSDLERAQLSLKKAQSEDAIEIQKLRTETAELNKVNKDQAKSVLGMVTPYQKFAKEVNEAKNRAKSLGAEMILLEQKFKNGELSKGEYNRQLNKLSKEFTEARVKAAGLDAQIKKIDGSVGDSQRNVGNYKSALGGLTSSFRNLLGAMGVVGGVALFGNLLQESYEAVKKLDAQNNALKQIFETEAQIAFQKEYLADVTNRYGLELVSATDGYTKYSAAVKGTALEGEKARYIFSSFSGASAKLGLNAEQQSGIFKALEQMISKGTVQAEELRGQLGDRMPGAFKLFADAAGVSTKELGEMLKKGEVLSDDILPKVAAKLNETYNLGTGETIDTLAAAQNRLKNSFTSFLDGVAGNKELISGLAVGMEGLGTVLSFLLDTLLVKGNDGVSVAGDLVEVLESLVGAVGDMSEGIGIMDKKTKNGLFSLNAFKNDLQSIQSVISVTTGLIKAVVEQFTGFFSTMFQDEGWSKYMKLIDDSNAKFQKIADNYNKIQSGVSKANGEGKAYTSVPDAYQVAWKKARDEKAAFFQLNGKYFDGKSGKNTGKSLDDYIDRGNQLVLKDKAPTNTGNNDSSTTKKSRSGGKSGSRLSGEQRDYLMGLQALRDLELAINEKRFTENEINERKYLENSLKINLNYFDKKIDYLKGRNAKEKLEEAKAELDRAKLIKETAKKIFDIDFKANEEIHKAKMEQFEKESKELQDNDYLSNSERLTRQIDIDNKMIDEATQSWKNQIAIAVAANQETLSLERKRDEEINKLQEKRLKNVSSGFENFKKDVEAQTEYLQTLKGITFEEQRQKILSDKKLDNKQKEYLLDILSLENQKEQNRLEIESLQKQNAELEKKAGNLPSGTLLTPEELQLQADNSEKIAQLGSQNIEIDISLKDKLFEQISGIKDIFTNGFRDLGLENFANEFESRFKKMFQNLKDGALDWKDVTALAVSLVSDLASSYVEQSTKQQIAALDEQLQRTQETTEQEIEFINGRLGQLNALSELSKEQTEERNALEDEARVLKEQQFLREKQIEAQKARAIQRANAQQTIIAGIQGAVMAYLSQLVPGDPTSPIRGAIAAAATLAFAGANAALIMSKNPVPEYFVGRKGGKAETAWTQEKGREIIAGRDGKIKSLGSDYGPVLTKLAEGDKVFTALESAKMIKSIPEINVGANIHRIDNSNLSPIIIQKDNIDYDKLAEKVGNEFRRGLKYFDKPTVTTDERGNKYMHEGGKIPVFLGREKKNTIIVKLGNNERN